MIDPSGLLETHSQLFEWFYPDTKALASQPKEILLLAFGLIDHKLEHLLVPKGKVLLQKLNTIPLLHQSLRPSPIHIQYFINARDILILVSGRVLVLVQHASLHLV